MSNRREIRTPLTPIRLCRNPKSDNNNIEKFNKIFTPQNSFNCNKDNSFSQNLSSTFNPDNKSVFHPIEFYALGKIPTGTVYPSFQWNKGIKSTSSNIIDRNILSINTKNFNQMYPYKKLSDLSQQNVTENNYMKPVKLYKTREKYNLPNNSSNFEIYKIMKEKYFSQDIQSPIAKGKLLNKTDYLKQKENSTKKIEFKKIEEIKDYNQGNDKSEIKNDKKSRTTSEFFFKDPNDYSKMLMKNNTFYFAQNNTQMIQPKKWKFGGIR